MEIVPQLNLNLLASADSYGRDVEDFEDYANNEFSLVLGGGYRFNFGLELDLRFQIGLTDVIEAPRNKINMQKFVLQLGISYWFLH